MNWTDEELLHYGLDPAKVKSLVRRLRRISTEMKEMGLHIYGASGDGCLIHVDRPTHSLPGVADYDSVIADLGEGFDGGDW